METKKIITAICATALVLGGVYVADQWITGGFSIIHVSDPISIKPEWMVPGPSQEERELLKRLLTQEFTYLDKGNQTYVFESADGKYVIKLFNFDTLKNHPKKDWKMDRLFLGYRNAFLYDRDHTGLIVYHLPGFGGDLPKLTLRSGWGFSQTVDPNSLVFVVQQKARVTRTVFLELLKKHDLQALEARIDALIVLYLSEYRRGLIDQDRNLIHNTGFVGTIPLRLDVGKLQHDPQIIADGRWREDLQKIMYDRLKPWLQKQDPSQAEEIGALVDKVYLKYKNSI